MYSTAPPVHIITHTVFCSLCECSIPFKALDHPKLTISSWYYYPPCLFQSVLPTCINIPFLLYITTQYCPCLFYCPTSLHYSLTFLFVITPPPVPVCVISPSFHPFYCPYIFCLCSISPPVLLLLPPVCIITHSVCFIGRTNPSLSINNQ